MTVVIFETERLIGRHVALADDQALLAVYGNARAMRHVGDGQPLDLAACQGWLAIIFQKYQKWGYGMSEDSVFKRHFSFPMAPRSASLGNARRA